MGLEVAGGRGLPLRLLLLLELGWVHKLVRLPRLYGRVLRMQLLLHRLRIGRGLLHRLLLLERCALHQHLIECRLRRPGGELLQQLLHLVLLLGRHRLEELPQRRLDRLRRRRRRGHGRLLLLLQRRLLLLQLLELLLLRRLLLLVQLQLILLVVQLLSCLLLLQLLLLLLLLKLRLLHALEELLQLHLRLHRLLVLLQLLVMLLLHRRRRLLPLACRGGLVGGGRARPALLPLLLLLLGRCFHRHRFTPHRLTIHGEPSRGPVLLEGLTADLGVLGHRVIRPVVLQRGRAGGGGAGERSSSRVSTSVRQRCPPAPPIPSHTTPISAPHPHPHQRTP